jgi:hypothetical protein
LLFPAEKRWFGFLPGSYKNRKKTKIIVIREDFDIIVEFGMLGFAARRLTREMSDYIRKVTFNLMEVQNGPFH